MVLNIGTATYETAKYLATVLSSLGESDYLFTSPTSPARFFTQIQKKKKKKPTRDKIISFHVKSPFTSVSLDEAITMILIKV